MVYYFSKREKLWIRDGDNAKLSEFNAKENKKRLKIKSPWRTSTYIYADVDDVKLLLNDGTYLLFYHTPGLRSMLCFTEDKVVNKGLLKNVSEDFTYLKKWVDDCCDVMTCRYIDTEHYIRNIEEIKKICINKMTIPQKLYYEVGD